MLDLQAGAAVAELRYGALEIHGLRGQRRSPLECEEEGFTAPCLSQELTFSQSFPYIMRDYRLVFGQDFVFQKGKKEEQIQPPKPKGKV